MSDLNTALDNGFVKAFIAFRGSAKTFSGRAAKVVLLALNRAVDNGSYAEIEYIEDQLKDKGLANTAKTALRRALRIGYAICAGEPVESKETPTFRVRKESVEDKYAATENCKARWHARRDLLKNLDAVSVQIVNPDPSLDALLEKFTRAANKCVAAGLTIDDLIGALKYAKENSK